MDEFENIRVFSLPLSNQSNCEYTKNYCTLWDARVAFLNNFACELKKPSPEKQQQKQNTRTTYAYAGFPSLPLALSVSIPISVFEYASTKTEYTDSEHNKDCIGKNVQVRHRCTLFILFSSPVLLHLPLFTYLSARLYLVAVCRCSFFSFRRIWMLFCGIVETLSNRRCVCMYVFIHIYILVTITITLWVRCILVTRLAF